MRKQETCDNCGRKVADRDLEALQDGADKRYLCEDCYLDRRSRRERGA